MQTSDENAERYQFADYWLIQYQILGTINMISMVLSWLVISLAELDNPIWFMTAKSGEPSEDKYKETAPNALEK